jgi:WD40 repeat protein
MLAVAYSGQPITLWDLEEDVYFGSCGKKLANGETSMHVVSALVFNPNVNIGLLAASYLDGELVLLDPFSDQEVEKIHANCHTLAASPDGRHLAGGAGFGTIQIYEFDTLKLLYRVKSSDFWIKQLTFSGDGLRFADIRGSQCNIWEPVILLRDMAGDNSSESSNNSVFEAVALETRVKISAILLHPKGEVVFCGKDDGSICLYDLKTGAQLQTLYRHKSLIRILTWWPQSNVLMSVDASNVILAWTIQKMQQNGWLAVHMLFQSRLDCGKSIIQLLPGEEAGKFVLSTRDSDHLWSINGQQEVFRPKRSGIRKWIQHQQSPLHLICIEGATAKIYTWSDWSEIATVRISIDLEGLQLKSVTSYISGQKQRILLELSELDGSANTRGLHLFDADSFSIGIGPAEGVVAEAEFVETGCDAASNNEGVIATETMSPLFSPLLASLAQHVAHIIGRGDNGRLIFLDTRSWVCSADPEDLDSKSVLYTRHFFVPYDWFSGRRDVTSAISRRDVLFARNDNVAIIKRGLEYGEKVEVKLESMGMKGTKWLEVDE